MRSEKILLFDFIYLNQLNHFVISTFCECNRRGATHTMNRPPKHHQPSTHCANFETIAKLQTKNVCSCCCCCCCCCVTSIMIMIIIKQQQRGELWVEHLVMHMQIA